MVTLNDERVFLRHTNHVGKDKYISEARAMAMAVADHCCCALNMMSNSGQPLLELLGVGVHSFSRQN